MANRKIKNLDLLIIILFVLGGLFSIAAVAKRLNKDYVDASLYQSEDHSGNHAAPANLGTQIDLTTQKEIIVNIKDYKFSQPNIKIKKGTKVTWNNQDSIYHNVMKAHVGEETAHEAPKKDEVKADHFAGPLLAQGESYSFTFNTIGENTYHCAPHPYMQGKVTVIE